MLRFWVSWYHEEPFSEFELDFPWWTTGYRCSDGAETICSAIIAPTTECAKEFIYEAYDVRPQSIEFRFVDPRADYWTPFGDRFCRREWMNWPEENKQYKILIL